LKIKLLIASLILLAFGCLMNCHSNQAETTPKFLNLNDTVEYVGMAMCRSCHSNVYDTYIKTGMGQSFGAANWQKTAASFGPQQAVYDSINDYHYYPFFEDSVLFVLEYRLDGQDTTHSRLERIDYIIGSGHHTNSHLINRNGYLYQAPITYYTQDGKWDLAPGFEEGNNQRFGRAILSECVTCHNHLPQPASGSSNKYHKMPLGIECERCHGPGEIHVNQQLAGKKVDTSKFVDYSIVNPRHLPIDRQMDLCQRCHLQGVAVLNEGKRFYDFKPGMALDEVMNVFLPRFTDSDKRFIMASQADRLRKSDCFKVSGQLSCISCHNPHHDVHSTTKNNYNTACINCHNSSNPLSKLTKCSESQQERQKWEDNCVGCHMPPSGSIDIPHVNITDHYISKENTLANRKMAQDTIEDIANFLGLQSLVKENPTPLDMAKGYLALYDKFMGEEAILDSVLFYLEKSTVAFEEAHTTWMHYYFNRKEYAQMVAKAHPASEIADAWTAYRIGEAAYKVKMLAKAKSYYQKATALQPYNLDFQEKYGTVLAQLGEVPKAVKVFEFVLSEDNKRKKSLANLGLALAQSGQTAEALKYYNRALALDPDYKIALLNKIGLLVFLKRAAEAQKDIQHLLDKYPSTKKRLQQLGVATK